MKIQELEQVIRQLLMDIYKAEYIGKLKVEKIGKGYSIKLGLLTPEAPYHIYAELEGESLIKFIKQQLIDRKLTPEFFQKVQTTYISHCNKTNTKCCDKKRINR